MSCMSYRNWPTLVMALGCWCPADVDYIGDGPRVLMSCMPYRSWRTKVIAQGCWCPVCPTEVDTPWWWPKCVDVLYVLRTLTFLCDCPRMLMPCMSYRIWPILVMTLRCWCPACPADVDYIGDDPRMLMSCMSFKSWPTLVMNLDAPHSKFPPLFLPLQRDVCNII